MCSDEVDSAGRLYKMYSEKKEGVGGGIMMMIMLGCMLILTITNDVILNFIALLCNRTLRTPAERPHSTCVCSSVS